MSMPVRVNTESGSVEGIEIRLLETSGVMVWLNAPSAPGVVVRIDDPEGLGVAIGPTDVTGRGAYATFALPRGVYSAHALAKGKQIASKEFTAGLDLTTVVLGPP